MSFYQEWMDLPNNKWPENEQNAIGFSVESDYIKEQREKALAYLGKNHVTAKDSTFRKSWRDF